MKSIRQLKVIHAFTLALVGSLLALAPAHAQVSYKPKEIDLKPGQDLEEVKDSVSDVIAAAMQEFVKNRNGESYRTFAVLPMKRDVDNGYGTLRLQDAFATFGKSSGYDVFTVESEKMQKALDQIEFAQNFSDAIDPSTIQKLGKIVNVEVVVLARLDVNTNSEGATTVRFNLEPYVVETMQRLAGGEKTAVIEPEALLPVPKSLMEKAYPWLLGIGGGLVLLLILRIVFRVIGNASRPR